MIEKANYTLKHGTTGEVLKGQAREVDTYEDLYCSDSGKDLIFVPKVIGVYQELLSDVEGNDELEKVYEQMSQSVAVEERGSRDDVHSQLICMIYDPQSIKPDVLRNSLQGDSFGRIQITPYSEIPDFNTKPLISSKKLADYMMKIDKENKRTKTILEREAEFLILNKRNYGLTRREAIELSFLRGLCSRLNGNPNLIHGKEAIDSFKGIQSFSRFFGLGNK